jgi:hypothetical protein
VRIRLGQHQLGDGVGVVLEVPPGAGTELEHRPTRGQRLLAIPLDVALKAARVHEIVDVSVVVCDGEILSLSQRKDATTQKSGVFVSSCLRVFVVCLRAFVVCLCVFAVFLADHFQA